MNNETTIKRQRSGSHKSTELPAGVSAPHFTLRSTPDQTVNLSDFRGQPVVLAFYPADWSPVCGDQMALISIETHTSNSDVLIVYDSVRSGKRAKELCDRLGQNWEMSLSVWSLSALQLPALERAAAHEAERTTLLIVAVNGHEALPRHVKTWLHRCARAIHAAGGALVAQLHGILKTNEELCPAYGCLKQIAHHAGVRFISEVVELPEDKLDCSLEAIHERAQPNHPCWGPHLSGI